MTEPDAPTDQDLAADDLAGSDLADDDLAADDPAGDDLPAAALSPADKRRSNLQLAAGVLIFLAASAAALLVAGNLGVTGVLIAALIEAAAIGWLYRWCEA